MPQAFFEDEGVRKTKIKAAADIAEKSIQQETELEKARIQAAGQENQQKISSQGLLNLEKTKQAGDIRTAREGRLGAPTSYEGGKLDVGKIREAQGKMGAAGVNPDNIPFESPITVIRGMDTTFAAAPGGKANEYSDIHLARQAINRAVGVGSYETPEVAAAKADPFKRFQARAGEIAVAQDQFEKRLSKYGKAGEDGKTTFSPLVRQILNEHAPQKIDDIDTAISKVQPLLEKAGHIDKLSDVKASRTLRAQMIESYKKLPADQKPLSDQEAEQYFTRFQPTMQNIDWAMKYGGLGGNLTPTGQAAAPGAPTNQSGQQMTVTKGGAGFVPKPPGYTAPAASTATAATPEGGGTVAALRPHATTSPKDDAAAYRQDYEASERLSQIMAKPISERTKEDIAFLQSQPPDANIQAQVGLHSFRKFFMASPDEYERRLGLASGGEDQLAHSNYQKNLQRLFGGSYGETW